MNDEPRLLTVRKVAVYLSTSVHAIRELYYKRELPALRIGRRLNFDRMDLDKYIERMKRTL